MPRPRTNDPIGVSDSPTNVVTDRTRVAAAREEFRRRLAFIEGTYRTTSKALGRDPDFNRSLAQLKRSLARTGPPKRRGDRAHPEVEMVIVKLTVDHAAARTGKPAAELTLDDLTQKDAQAGARKAAELLQPRRGRSRNSLLRHYVEGQMALIQEFTGRPVRLTLHKDNIYDPQAIDGSGRILLIVARQLEPTATVSTIASIVKQARRKYAGKRMRFAEFFPTYGLNPSWARQAGQPGSNIEVLLILPPCPIYFP